MESRLNNLTFKQKLHSHGWLILINALIAIAVSTRYFAFLPEFPSELTAITFIIAGTFSQMVLLASIIGIIALPFLMLPIKARRLSQSLIAASGIALLFIDSIVFAQYRFHINFFVVDMLLSGQIVSFPLITWLMVIAGMLLLVISQWLLVRWLEGEPVLVQLHLGRKFAFLVFIALLATNGIHIWASAYAYQPVTVVKRYLPLFLPATSNTLMRKYGWIDEQALENQQVMQVKIKSDLHYPLSTLKTEAVEKPVNIMWLVIDSWRGDTFNAQVTPNLWSIVQKNDGVVFNNHLSTGNSTRTGIFGLFYALPGTYWHGFLANRRAPLFIERLQALNYDLGIFAAAQLRSPEFDQTVFVNVPNLRNGSTGNRPSELDKDLTKDWLAWNEQRDHAKPAFSFLFYDSPHGYDFPDDYSNKFEPYLKTLNYLELNNETDTSAFFNRYKTSVRFVDSQIKHILDKLQESGEMDNTLVIITGDHGQEINDNKLNFWGHNSNFTNAQVQVPFAIFGPGISKESMQWDTASMTSHQDVVPTIMKHYLGVDNDVADYSAGEDLLAKPVQREWLVSSNYSGYAVVTDKSILEVTTSGNYELFDKTNRPLKGQDLNYSQVEQVLEQISRFNK
ncbi:MAG: membrane-anchored protein YejM (alkaline phosphatase superfamily) [Psychromonas sp.]